MKVSFLLHCAASFLLFFLITSVNLTFAQSEGRDGNNYAPNPPGSSPKPERPSYSDRYRERYNSDQYRERHDGENYRQTSIEEGFRRRHEHFSGDSNIRFDSTRVGATLGRPPQDIPRDMFVEIGEDASTFYSGKGLRLPLPSNQPREIDPMRQQKIQSLLQPPALLRQYVNQSQLLQASQAFQTQPQPVGDVPLGFQQPQNNTIQQPNRFIPPVNQSPVRPNNDMQPFIPLQTIQPDQPGINQNVQPNYLPYPLNMQQQRYNNANPNSLSTRPYNSQRNLQMNQRYLPVQLKQPADQNKTQKPQREKQEKEPSNQQ
jgi:hypothetical protein